MGLIDGGDLALVRSLSMEPGCCIVGTSGSREPTCPEQATTPVCRTGIPVAYLCQPHAEWIAAHWPGWSLSAPTVDTAGAERPSTTTVGREE